MAEKKDSALVELMAVIQDRIKEAHDRVYLEEVPEKEPGTGKAVQLPYICWRLPTSTQRELPDEIFLEVDIWDKADSTVRLENLTAAVDSKLNLWGHIGSLFGLRIFRINRLQIPDPDPKIRRRRLVYLVRVWFVVTK